MFGLTKFIISVTVVFLLFCSFIIITSQLNFKRPRIRIIIFQAVSLSILLYALWPLLPHETALERTANSFLKALSQGDAEEAFTYIVDYTGIPESERLVYEKDITEPSNFIKSWEITSINQRDIVVADVQFADGAKDEIILYHSWDLSKARWGISSAFFQNDRERLRLITLIGFTNRFPFIPYQLFYTLSIILGIYSLFSGRKFIPGLRSIFAK